VSDFFANLAARTRDSRTAIRPRLPKRFEPSAPTPQLAEVAPETDSVGEDLTSNVSQSDSAPPRPERLSQEEPGRRRSGLPAPPQLEIKPQRSNAPTHVDIPDTPATQQPPTTMALITRGAAVDSPLPSAAPASGVERTVFVAHRATHSATAPPPPQAEPQRSDLATPSMPISQTVRAPFVQPDPAPSPVASHQAPLTRRELKARAARAVRQPPTQPEPAAPETTVHVSIGRIELRMPPGASPKKRERASAPVAPLSDYLQKHNAARKRP
jgi:hypothetical protein